MAAGNQPELDDDFQWLALMQHHGAPTRLIDFNMVALCGGIFRAGAGDGPMPRCGL